MARALTNHLATCSLRICRRSSVVEQSLGKREIVGPTPTGGSLVTDKAQAHDYLDDLGDLVRHGLSVKATDERKRKQNNRRTD